MKFQMTEHGFETETEFGKLEISSNEEKGFRPYQLMVSSIAACTGGVMRKILEKKRMPAESIDIEVKEVIRSQDDASRLEKIHLHIKVKADGLTDEKMPKILELTDKNCSMYQSVANCIDVRKTYELLN
ncbi:OsmC family protein [Sporosarcina sp. D27]|uniref:OsmC family protein n=1 Tax=Sporosarcina sp. D27 TaxID=1382305 RepID=UPI000471F5B8|nr:OsmC family protein [Sporosarcina sp. D27]